MIKPSLLKVNKTHINKFNVHTLPEPNKNLKWELKNLRSVEKSKSTLWMLRNNVKNKLSVKWRMKMSVSPCRSSLNFKYS